MPFTFTSLCVFHISILYEFFKTIYINFSFFQTDYFIFNLSCFQTVSIILKLNISFFDTFLCFSLFYLYDCCLFKFSLNPTNSLMICLPNSSFINPVTFYFFLQKKVCLIQNFNCQILFQHLYMYNDAVSIHITKSCLFNIFQLCIIISKFIHYSFTKIKY